MSELMKARVLSRHLVTFREEDVYSQFLLCSPDIIWSLFLARTLPASLASPESTAPGPAYRPPAASPRRRWAVPHPCPPSRRTTAPHMSLRQMTTTMPFLPRRHHHPRQRLGLAALRRLHRLPRRRRRPAVRQLIIRRWARRCRLHQRWLAGRRRRAGHGAPPPSPPWPSP